MSTGERQRRRGGLREVDQHASWREVYASLDVEVSQHEQQPEVGDVSE